MYRLFLYERPTDGQRVEIFLRPSPQGTVYVIREGNSHDSVTPDRPDVDRYRTQLREQGFMLRHESARTNA